MELNQETAIAIDEAIMAIGARVENAPRWSGFGFQYLVEGFGVEVQHNFGSITVQFSGANTSFVSINDSIVSPQLLARIIVEAVADIKKTIGGN
ncbi:hypothetical protein UFOVP1616_8 [uncultured Caudovirales phage]|uniref:Uncharacterized protein n=1 Tax=uncultured Caudovirales phage TaxID=2100421 RepID=A0A6J5SYY8_9CAUD|nr:hypothetical protein UFOVP1467_24 [uncultured Caudovirales phage]CAB4219627.1 hypothetical protein UFOVP1616_8 [uncultured Caudovirales phage]